MFKVSSSLVFLGAVSLVSRRAETSIFSSSDQGTRGPAILRMPAGVRARGLGGSYVAVADDAASPQWNPAGLQRVRAKEMQFMRAQLFADQNQQFLGYAHPSWRNRDRETWAINASLLDVGSFDVRLEGASIASAQPRETAAGISFARSFWNQDWGLTGKLVQVETYGQKGQAYACDFGSMGYWPSANWTWGAALSNVGTTLTLGDQSISLPRVARAGVAWTKATGPGRFLVTGQGDYLPGETTLGRAGLEYSVPFQSDWRTALRAGVQTARSEIFSMGFGVQRRSLGIDYTFSTNGDLGNTVWMDLTFTFGGALAPEVERAQLVSEVEELIEEGEWNRAREAWGRLNALSPGQATVRRLGRVLNTQRMESLDPAIILAEGQEAYHQHQYSAAADHFNKLLLVAPDHIEGREWLKKTQLQIEADQQERLKAEVAIVRERERKQLVHRAETLEARQRWMEALRAWIKVLDRGGDAPEAQNHLRSCQEKVFIQAEEAVVSGDVEKALMLFHVLEERGPYRDAGSRVKHLEREHTQHLAEAAQAKYREGRDAYVHGDLAKARRLFEEALSLDPGGKGVRQALEQVTEELKLAPKPKP